MKKFLTISFFLTILSNSLNSQNTIGLPRIRNYSKTDFKAGTQTWDIEQDAKGRMFFANNEGVLSFNGSFWKLFPLPNKTIVRSIALSPEGKIYAGGQGEMGYFEADESGKLQYHSLIPLIPSDKTLFADIWDIEFYKDAVFFRASDRIFEYKNNTIQQYNAPNEWVFFRKAGATLLAQDKQKGLFEYREKQWYPIENKILQQKELMVGAIQKGRDSLLLVSSLGKFMLLKNKQLSLLPSFLKFNLKSDIYKAVPVNESEMALATTGEGCITLDFGGRMIQQFSRQEGLQNNAVLALCLDRDKNIWTGLNNGISYIAYNSAIKYINPKKENELSGYSTQLFENRLYIGCSDGCYSAPLDFSRRDLSFSKASFTNVGNSKGQVWRLSEVNGQLLMAHTSGLFRIEKELAAELSPDPGWLFVPTSALIPAEEILVGHYTGIKRLSFRQGRFSDEGNLEGLNESLRFLTIDNKGKIWASHPYRGIYQINISRESKRFSTKLYTEKDGLPSALENHVFKVKNKVVFATSNGAYEFNESSGRFIKSAFLEPVLGNMPIRYLNEDADGNIWFCTGKKLGAIRYQENKSPEIIFFPEINGQILSGFENVYPFDRENVFVASEKGIIHINLEKYKARKKPLGIVLGEISASGTTDSLIFGGQQENIAEEKPMLHLPHDFQSFHFEFSSPSYETLENIEYSFYLEGSDNQWSQWNSRPEKEYTNLTNGRYRFRVKARDNLGNESDSAVYEFEVDPPWYKTSIAFLFYLILVGLGIRKGYQLQQRKLLLQKKKYEEKQEQLQILHQLELEKNEKEIMRLQNEQLINEMMFKNKELAETGMHLVERSDALIKVREELQKLYKNTSENHDIKKTLQMLNDIEKNNANWEKFATHFDEINDNFLKNLKTSYPGLTNNDLKLCTYLQLNLASKEIAQMMNISTRGIEISRYRLRKKLGIPTETTLSEFFERFRDRGNQ